MSANDLRRVFRFCLFVAIIGSYILTCIGLILFIPARWNRRKLQTCTIGVFSRVSLWALGIRLKINSLAAPQANQNYFVVSNHLSYLDILIISSQMPCCFVTSEEMRENSLLGILTQVGGCIFVERRDKSRIDEEIAEINAVLNQGLNVCVFPEATTTNGEAVLRFRRPLYKAAVSSQRNVLPLVLNYISVDRAPVHHENRDLLFWYGEMPFFKHLWDLLNIREILVTLTVEREIESRLDSCHVRLAEESHSVVASHYRPLLPA